MQTKKSDPESKRSDSKNTSGEEINVDPTIASQTTDAVVKRLEKVHPNAKKKVRPTALYVSNGLQEYEIKREGPFWFISPYKGGQLPDHLVGLYQTYRLAESDLINYLRLNDRRGHAIWPGK